MILSEPLLIRRVPSSSLPSLFRRYTLSVVQQPLRSAEFGSNVLSRLPLNPPLIVKLDVHDAEGNEVNVLVQFLDSAATLAFVDADLALLLFLSFQIRIVSSLPSHSPTSRLALISLHSIPHTASHLSPFSSPISLSFLPQRRTTRLPSTSSSTQRPEPQLECSTEPSSLHPINSLSLHLLEAPTSSSPTSASEFEVVIDWELG